MEKLQKRKHVFETVARQSSESVGTELDYCTLDYAQCLQKYIWLKVFHEYTLVQCSKKHIQLGLTTIKCELSYWLTSLHAQTLPCPTFLHDNKFKICYCAM